MLAFAEHSSTRPGFERIHDAPRHISIDQARDAKCFQQLASDASVRGGLPFAAGGFVFVSRHSRS